MLCTGVSFGYEIFELLSNREVIGACRLGRPRAGQGLKVPRSRASTPAGPKACSEAQPRPNSDSLAPGFRLDPDDPARAFRSGPSRTPAGHDRELGRRGWGGVTLSVHIGLTHGSPFK